LLILGIALAFGVAGAAALSLVGCGSGRNAVILPPPPTPAFQPLTQSEVTQIVTAPGAGVLSRHHGYCSCRPARKSFGCVSKANAPNLLPGNFSIMEDAKDVAVSLARTGAFFSNNQAPLTSRTVRFISGIHLPPGVTNQPPADLYGIENTNRGCTLSAELESHGFKPATAISGAKPLGSLPARKI